MSAVALLVFPGGVAWPNLFLGVTRPDAGSLVTGVGLLAFGVVIVALVAYALQSEVRLIGQVVTDGAVCEGRLRFIDATRYVLEFTGQDGVPRRALLGRGALAPQFWGEGTKQVVHDPARPLMAVLMFEKDGKLSLVKAFPVAD